MKLLGLEVTKYKAVTNTGGTVIPINIAPKSILSNEEKLFSVEQLRTVFGYFFNDILPNPDPIIKKIFLKNLTGEYEIYQDIMSDDMVSTCLDSLTDGVNSNEWRLNQLAASQKAMDLINLAFETFNVYETISAICETPNYGRNFLIPVWNYVDGFIVPTAIDNLPFTFFKYDIFGNIKMLGGSYNTYDRDVPPYRVLNPRYKPSSINPMGKSILTKCYWRVFFKKNSQIFWNVFAEKYGQPWSITKYSQAIIQQLWPDVTPETALGNLLTILKNQVRDAAVAMPEGVDTEFSNPASQANINVFKELELSCNEAISRVLLGHTGTSTSTPGKLGSEKAAIDVRADKIEMRKRLVSETLNTLIRWIVEININETEYPVFEFFREENLNKDKAEIDCMFAEKLGTQFTVDYLVKTYHYQEGDIAAIIPRTNQNPMAQAQAKPKLSPKLKQLADKVLSGEIVDFEQLNSEVGKFSKTIQVDVQKIIKYLV